MPPRRGGRRRGGPQRNRNVQPKMDAKEWDMSGDNINEPKSDATTEVQNAASDSQNQVNQDTKTPQSDEVKKDESISTKISTVEAENGKNGNEEKIEFVPLDLPYKVKVSHLPANYDLNEFEEYVKATFKVQFPKIISPGVNSPWLLIPFATKEEQENLVRLLHNHIWKKKAVRAIAFYGLNSQKHKLEDGEDSDGKRFKADEVPVLTLEEEILSESLPLYSVPYEEQNRLTMVDVELLSNKLHAFMCVRNPALAGWAESMCEQNKGCLFKVEPLKPSPLLEGYRNKCKFRIGKNTEGETTVGFCLNDNENKILGVQPGDKLIHLPDSMKYAAKKFEDFVRVSGKEPYNKRQKSGFWDHIVIRVTPEGKLMLVIVMYHNQLSEENFASIKNEIKDYFVNGGGKDCKLYSLYFQIMYDKTPILPSDKLDLLHGETHFYENICNLKFYVGPFSILNVNSSSSENIYKSIVELAEPTLDTTIIDLCSGTGGIAFTIANKCKQVIAIESQGEHIKDAHKTKEINGITNVEFIHGKVEDVLAGIFEKLGDAEVIPVIDPPRQGLVQKAISQLRAQENIKKLVYVCSNSKMGAKNFLDLCAAADKKEGTYGNPLNVAFVGLPFLPVRAIPVDVAPYTVNNTIIILFERVDPSTFPPAKNPPPVPLKRPETKKNDKKKRRPGRRFPKGGNVAIGKNFGRQGKKLGGRMPPGSLGRGGGGRGGPFFRRGRSSRPPGFNQGRFPPPLMRPVDSTQSLVEKYKRRIAELVQQDRAFKAGLSMGLQALGTRGGPSGGSGNFGNNFDGNMGMGGNNFGNFGMDQFPRDRSVWQSDQGRNFGNFGFSGENNFSGGFGPGGFNNYNNNSSGFGNFGMGSGGSNFNSNFNNTSGGFRNYQGNKHRR